MMRWLPLLFVPLVAWFKDASVVVLALAAILGLAYGQTRRAVLAYTGVSLTAVAFSLFAAWTLVTFAWAPAWPLANWAKAFVAIAMIALALRAADSLPDRDKLIRDILIAWVGLFFLLVVERATGGFFLGLQRVHDSAERNFDTLSPGLAFLTCLTFPVAQLTWQRYRRPAVPVALVLACFALGVTYRMDAAPIAILAGGIAFIAVRRSPGARWRRSPGTTICPRGSARTSRATGGCGSRSGIGWTN